MVGGSSTGLEHSDQVVDHSPSTSGVVGDGSTGPKSFVALDVEDIHIDGFSTRSIARDVVLPMTMNHSLRLYPTGGTGSTSVYAGESTFKEHSRHTYEGPIFLPSFYESFLIILILANRSMHATDPDMLSLARLEPWVLRFSNSARHYTHVHKFEKNDNKLYRYDPLPRRWDQIPDLGIGLDFTDFTRIPFPLNSRAPHLPYIVRRSDDPTLPSDTDIVSISRDEVRLNYRYTSSLVAFADRSRTRFSNWKGVLERLKLPDSDILPTPPLGQLGSPQSVIEGPFKSLGRAREVCSDILRVSYEYGGLARFWMHRYIDHITREGTGESRPRHGVDNSMVGAVFRFPLPRSLVAIQATLSELESHGVPIFGVEELVDRTRYDVYGPKRCRDAVLSKSNPAAVSNPHRISVEMVPQHEVVHPLVWIMKSDIFPKLRRITNYLDEDVYQLLIKRRSREPLEYQFVEVFGVESIHLPPLEPSNYFEIPPPPPPPAFVPTHDLTWDESAGNSDEEMEDEWERSRQKGNIEQEREESDEAFNTRKAKAEAKKAAEIARRDAAAEYIRKARGGDLDVYRDIVKRIKMGKKEKTPFDAFLTSMWRKVYTKDVYAAAKNKRSEGKPGHKRAEAQHKYKEDDARMRAGDSYKEVERHGHEEENSRMQTEEDSRKEAEVCGRKEDNTRMRALENDQQAEEDARQQAEGSHQPMEEDVNQKVGENHQAAENDAPSGAELTAQNASEVGDDKKDHNNDSTDKAADELAKMAVDDRALTGLRVGLGDFYTSPPYPPDFSPATLGSPASTPPQPKLQSSHRSATPPDVVSLLRSSERTPEHVSNRAATPPDVVSPPGSSECTPAYVSDQDATLPDVVSPPGPSEYSPMRDSNPRLTSPSHRRSSLPPHQVSLPHHELSPLQPRARSRSLTPPRAETQGGSVSPSNNLPHPPPKSQSGMQYHSSRRNSRPSEQRTSSSEGFERGSRDLPSRSHSRSHDLPPRSHDFPSHSRDFPPRPRDFPPRPRNLPPRNVPPRSHDFPPHSRDPPSCSRDLPRSRDLAPRSRDLSPRSRDLAQHSRDLDRDRICPATSQTSQSRQPPTAPRAFHMRGEAAISNDWRARTVGNSREMPRVVLEGAGPSNFVGSSRGRQQQGPDARAYQKHPALTSSTLGSSHCK